MKKIILGRVLAFGDVWNGMYHDAKYSNKSSSGK